MAKTETRKLLVSICGIIKLVFIIQNVSTANMNAATESIIYLIFPSYYHQK